MDEHTLRDRIEFWHRRAAEARDLRERATFLEIVAHYAALADLMVAGACLLAPTSNKAGGPAASAMRKDEEGSGPHGGGGADADPL